MGNCFRTHLVPEPFTQCVLGEELVLGANRQEIAAVFGSGALESEC